MKKQKKKLIIVPAYNEETCIEMTVKDIKEHAKDFDYVIINDCSSDNTGEVCESHGFHVIHLPVNLGIGGAVQTGFLYAWRNGYDMAVQFDGDGQHDASFLQKMADLMETDGLDMVIGSRFIKKEGFQSSRARRMGIWYFSFLIRLLTKSTITDPTSGFRIVNRKLIGEFALEYPKDYPEPESVVNVLRNGGKVKEIPVLMQARQGGVSSISPKNAIYYMVKVTLAILVERFR